MKRKLIMFRSLLIVAIMLVGGGSAWATQSTWTYSTTLLDNTIGSPFSGSTAGLVSVQLGATSESTGWSILTYGSGGTKRGLFHTDATATLTDGIPTSGTFMKIEALQKVAFIPHFYRTAKGYLRMVDASDTGTFIFNVRYAGSATSYPTATLQSGHTYYLWFAYDANNECKFAITGFEAISYNTYTINYTYGGSTIATEGEADGYVGQTVSAAYSSVWDDGNTTKYYVADNATTSFTVAESGNTFEVALRLAATDAVASINAIDNEGTVLATFTGGSGIEGETYNGYVYYTRAVLYNGSYYAVSASNGNGYNYGKNGLVYGTPGIVTYTLDNTISYYAEIENIEKTRDFAAEGAVPERASGGHWYRLYRSSYAYTASDVLAPGVYTLEVSGRNSGSSAATLDIKVRTSNGTLSDAIAAPSWNSSGNVVNTVQNILVPTGASVAICQTADYNSNIGLDYIILRKIYDVTDASKIIGAVDFTTAANAEMSSDYTLSQGETKVITFRNHGTTYGNNWRLFVTEGVTVKSVTRADSWDETTNAATALSYQVSKDGGNTKESLNWEEYAADMADANVVAKLTYGTDGTLTIKTEATGAANGYIYYVNQSVSGLTNDLTINLSVCNSWLEVLSVETPQKNTYTATFYNDANWNTVKAFAWTTDGNVTDNYLGAWSGTAINGEDGVYTLTFQAVEAPANIIFNNGNSGEGNQTADLVFENGASYCSAGKVLYTAYYQDTWNWGTVYGYAWSGENGVNGKQLGDWPGKQLRKFGDYYTAFITATPIPDNIIFHKNDGNKTGDLTFVDGAVYSYYGPQNTVSVTTGTNGYGTFASPYALDLANLPTGLKTYKAAVNGTTVNFTEVNEAVQANTGLLIEGAASETYSIPVAASGADISATNEFLVNTGGSTFTAESGYTYYGLMKNTLTFGTFNPESVAIPADKAYLKVATNGARLSISFDDETTTGIQNNNRETITNSRYYNMNGQVVAQPSKGLYIVNGKKVVIK